MAVAVLIVLSWVPLGEATRRHNTQHNDIHRSDTKHNGTTLLSIKQMSQEYRKNIARTCREYCKNIKRILLEILRILLEILQILLEILRILLEILRILLEILRILLEILRILLEIL